MRDRFISIRSLTIQKMSDQTQAELEAAIEAKLEEADTSDESQDDSELDSDTEADESDDDSATEEKEDDTSESESEETDTDSDVEFDFHNTSTSVQNLVNRLKDMPEAERQEHISKLTRKKEIEAVKKAFPDVEVKDATISKQDYQRLLDEIEALKKNANVDELKEALAIAQKLRATEKLTDSKMKSLMLQEQFGEDYKKVANDTKFMTAFEKYPQLPLEDRLSLACSLSPVAKKLASESEVDKQLRLANTKTVSKGKQKSEVQQMTKEDVNSLDDFEKAMKQRFDG